mgnify:CR=1 FL=1
MAPGPEGGASQRGQNRAPTRRPICKAGGPGLAREVAGYAGWLRGSRPYEVRRDYAKDMRIDVGSVGSVEDLHSPHWHGNTGVLVGGVVNRRRLRGTLLRRLGEVCASLEEDELSSSSCHARNPRRLMLSLPRLRRKRGISSRARDLPYPLRMYGVTQERHMREHAVSSGRRRAGAPSWRRCRRSR